MYIIIPHQAVAPDILDSMLEEIVSRDGTDYGHIEIAMPDRVKAARDALVAGRAALVWDDELESASLVSPEMVRAIKPL